MTTVRTDSRGESIGRELLSTAAHVVLSTGASAGVDLCVGEGTDPRVKTFFLRSTGPFGRVADAGRPQATTVVYSTSMALARYIIMG